MHCLPALADETSGEAQLQSVTPLKGCYGTLRQPKWKQVCCRLMEDLLMQQPYQVTEQLSQEFALRQNRVLRNTYLLLALSMLPTTFGALMGVQMRFSFFAGSPMVSFLLFMGIAFAFMWGIERNKNSGVGVAVLLGFTFFMGLMLSRILQVALGFSNGGALIDRNGCRWYGGYFLHLGNCGDSNEKGFWLPWQVPVYRSCADFAGGGGEYLFPNSRTVADDISVGRADLFSLHSLRYQPYREWWRGQLHFGDTGGISGCLQSFCQLTQSADGFCRAA